MYGAAFLLEQNVDGNWYEVSIIVEEDHDFTSIGYELHPSYPMEWRVDWEQLYGKLPSGDYRIVKGISEVTEAVDAEEYHLAAEFTVD